jgi:hypothetical protein
MQVMRHGDIDHIDEWIRQQFLIVCGLLHAGRDAVEPPQCGRIEVRDSSEHGSHRHVRECAPPCKRAGHFPTHEAAADDADVDVFHDVSEVCISVR